MKEIVTNFKKKLKEGELIDEIDINNKSEKKIELNSIFGEKKKFDVKIIF